MQSRDLSKEDGDEPTSELWEEGKGALPVGDSGIQRVKLGILICGLRSQGKCWKQGSLCIGSD